MQLRRTVTRTVNFVAARHNLEVVVTVLVVAGATECHGDALSLTC